jgi:hypothetical protein
MKIIPFNQHETRIPQKKTALSPEFNFDFQKTLERAVKTPEARDRVVAENRNAVLNLADKDLAEAKSLMVRLTESLKEAGAEKLEMVHNLEGVLYFFQA